MSAQGSSHRLMFPPLAAAERSFIFPCDAGGRVDLDRLDEGRRNDYFYARAMLGRSTQTPRVLSRMDIPRSGAAPAREEAQP